jgi:hypothetical protein
MRDRRTRKEKERDARRDEDGRTEYDKIIDGEIIPEGHQKGWVNLEKRTSFNRMDKEKHREISRKGAEAVNKLHGERKTAKQALENILTLKIDDRIIGKADLEPELAERLKRSNPDATLYDLMQIVAVSRAVGGNMKAYELIRDTYGDMPVKQIEVTENVTTESDRAMMAQLAAMLQNGGQIEVVKDVSAEDIKNGNGDGS